MSLYLESLRDYGIMYTTWDRVETRQQMVRMMMVAFFKGGGSWLSVRWPKDWCEVTMQLGPHMLEDGAVAFIIWLLRGHLAEQLVIVDNPMYTCHDFWELVGSYVRKLSYPNIVRFKFFMIVDLFVKLNISSWGVGVIRGILGDTIYFLYVFGFIQ